MRILGVDFGRAKIGIAVAETEPRIASPRRTLEASGKLATDAANIVRIALLEGAELIVVGLPLSMGEETQGSRVCRKLGDEIAGLGSRVAFADESLTTLGAETAMKEAGMKGSQRRKAVDSESACRILERYMEEHGP